MFGNPFLSLCGGPIVNCYVMSSRGDMSCHRIAHDTQSEKYNLCHFIPPFLLFI